MSARFGWEAKSAAEARLRAAGVIAAKDAAPKSFTVMARYDAEHARHVPCIPTAEVDRAIAEFKARPRALPVPSSASFRALPVRQVVQHPRSASGAAHSDPAAARRFSVHGVAVIGDEDTVEKVRVALLHHRHLAFCMTTVPPDGFRAP